jgi:hypothetical protein
MTTQENSQPQQEQQLDTETGLDEATLDGVVGGAAPPRSALTNKAVLGGYKDYDPVPAPKPVAAPSTKGNGQTGGRFA